MSHEDAGATIARFADPRLGLGASEDELRAWVEEGKTLSPPLSPEASIRRNLPTRHQGLLTDIALKYLHRGLDLDDLIGEGQLALIRAAKSYDPGRLYGDPPSPIRFSTLATQSIHRQLRRGIQDRGRLIRVPEDLQKHLGPSPPIGPLTRWESERLEDARRAMRKSAFAVSLSWRRGEDPDGTAEIAASAPERGRAREECEALLATLSERERGILLARRGFLGPVPTYAQLAGGRSWQSIQQVELRAMRKLVVAARRKRITYEGIFGEVG